MLAWIYSAAPSGIEAFPAEVEVNTGYGETIINPSAGLTHPAAILERAGIVQDKKPACRRIPMTANFRRLCRGSALALFLAAAGATAALAEARPDLTGQVLAQGGASLPVPATVFILTAGPKSGTSPFCPSCYADCQKGAKTDGNGNFEIKSLDPQLRFQILAVAKGYKPQYANQVDPAAGPIKVSLTPIELASAPPGNCLHGRVVDAKGKPVAGAVVGAQGIRTRDGGGLFGSLPGVDPLAVSDENGGFLITSQKPFELMDVRVSARGFANKTFTELASGNSVHELTLAEGASIRGRVLYNGQPLTNISVGVVSVNRDMDHYTGNFDIGTDSDGRFLFVSLPPEVDYYIYGLMNTLKSHGAIPLQTIHAGKDGGLTDVGNLVVGPAYRLAGRVVLSDGQPVPSNTRLLISREAAWDTMQPMLDQDGKFDATGIPPETISLGVRLKGYHVSARNLSVDQMNPFQLIGRVDRDITNLVFLLEKGPDPQPDYSHVDPEYDQSRQRSLHGAEGVPDHSHEWIVSGRVLDGETKQPVQNFRVTPGQTDNFNQTAWSTLRAVDGSNGVYLAYVGKRTAQPLLKVEAEGYLPESAELLPGATNLDFILKKGSGPAGTVVTPDGKPAVGATIVLLNDDYNQAGFNSAGELTAYGNKSNLHTADTNGNFAFKPVWGIKSVVAASSNGFAVVSLESFATNSTITLEPFGRITGTLKRASGPGTNESLGLMFAGVNAPRINFSQQAVTDSEGRFNFDHVPAGHLQIWARKPVPGDRQAWSNEALQEVDLKPGQTLEVNITADDRAAAEAVNSHQPPQPKLIPGAQVKGVVLLPGGRPAVDADVVLQVEGKYLGLGKAAFTGSPREEGLLVSAGQDGGFTLPMYEGAKSVIALNEEGYAQVSLEQLKASPQITLQKWGRIEGTLRFGHHAGTNEQVVLDAPQPGWIKNTIHKPGSSTNDVVITNSSPAVLQPPYYDFNAFQAKTDERGRFVITFVPPGEQIIARLVPTGEGSWTHSQLTTVDVKPGETVVTNVGGMGRTVIGKVKVDDGVAPDFKNGFANISTPTSKLFSKIKDLKSDEERKAFFQSNEIQEAMKNHRSFSAVLLLDGSFRAEDVLPGKYEFGFQSRQPDKNTHSLPIFVSAQELVVPEARDKDDDSSVDWGAIELKPFAMPMPGTESGRK